MSDDYGYRGRQDPGSAPNDYNALEFMVRQILADVYTATPVQVVKAPYDKNGNPINPGDPVAIGFIDVKPLVNQIDGLGRPTPHDVVHRIKYHRYQSSYGAIIADPKVNDIGHLSVADRDISSVVANAAAANPGSRRRFSLEDGTYHGQHIAETPPTQYLTWKGGQGFKLVDSFGNTIEGTNAGIVINGKVTITRNGDVQAQGEVVAQINAANIHLSTHTHDGVMSGSSNTTAPNSGT